LFKADPLRLIAMAIEKIQGWRLEAAIGPDQD